MGVEGAFSRLPGTLGLVATGLLALHAALQYAADEVDKSQKSSINKATETDRLMRAYKAFELNGQQLSSFETTGAHSALQMIREFRLLKDGKIDNARFAAYVGGLTNVDMEGARAARRMFDSAARYMPIQEAKNAGYGLLPKALSPEQDALNRNMPPRNHTTNITNNNHIVQTIENANDPDRVLVKTKEALESIYRHETVSPYNRFATVR
jgi:hypothetical protein